MAEAPVQQMPTDPSNSTKIPITPLIILVIFVITCILFLRKLYGYPHPQGNHGQQPEVNNQAQEVEVQPVGGGVHPSVREELPRIIYNPESSSSSSVPYGQSTCSLCLSDFADGEQLSLLPSCGHVFHADCIGEYLTRNRTCPYCRRNISLLQEASSSQC